MRFAVFSFAALSAVNSVLAAPASQKWEPMEGSVMERSVMLTEVVRSEQDLDFDKRLTVTEMIAITSVGVAAIGMSNAISNYVAALIKQASDQNSCGIITGYINGVNYQYQASTTGKNCDTTAQEKTISNAIERGINFMNNNNAKSACFNMQHGGTWTGFLQIAANGDPIVNNKCESVTYTLTV